MLNGVKEELKNALNETAEGLKNVLNETVEGLKNALNATVNNTEVISYTFWDYLTASRRRASLSR